MGNSGIQRFKADTTLISGAHSLEKIPYALSRIGAVRPLILMHENSSLSTRNLIKRVFSYAVQEIPAFCFIDDRMVPEQLDEVSSAISDYACDSIIAVGSSCVQSAGKLANSLYSCRLSAAQMYRLPCTQTTLLKSAAVLTEDTDGSELCGIIELFSREISHPNLAADIAVIDPRVLGESSEAATAASLLITLVQIYHAVYELGNSPAALSLLTPAAQMIMDAACRLEEPEARYLAVQSAALTQIVFENCSTSGIWALLSSAGSLDFISREQAAAGLLPHIIKLSARMQPESVELLHSGAYMPGNGENNMEQTVEKLIVRSHLEDGGRAYEQLCTTAAQLSGAAYASSVHELILSMKPESR
jgi:alcohol dehydrogenase class IV